MNLSSQHQRRSTPAAIAASPTTRPDPLGLLLVAAAAPLVASAGSAWLLLHARPGFTGSVAAAAGTALLCAAAAAVVTSRYRRAVTAAVRTAVRQATRDPLTGLPTRAALREALEQADTAGTPYTVVLLDVDGLHDINSSWGHAAGDQYLAAIAARLATAVPAHSCLVRQGGDELTIVAAGAAAATLRARITAALAAPALIAGRQVPLRVSAGVAVGGCDSTGTAEAADLCGTVDPADARDATDGAATYVLACADAAMYTAKHHGGGQVLLYRADRDGRPALDGTRPVLRRRDSRPDGLDGPEGLEGLEGLHRSGIRDTAGRDASTRAARDRLPVYLTDAERHLLRRLLHNATVARYEQAPFAGSDTEVQTQLTSIAEHLAAGGGRRRRHGNGGNLR